MSVLQLIVAALLWSTGGVLVKTIDWSPLAIAGMRSAIAAVTLLVLVRRPHFHWSTAQILAAFFYAGTVVLFVLSTRLTTAANAIFLQYTAPIYIALLSGPLLGEKPTRFDWAMTALAFCGICLFFLDQLSTSGFWGIVLATISGLSFAGLSITMRKQKTGSPIESVILGNGLAAIIGLPAIVTAGAPAGPAPWTGLLVLGIFQLALAYWLYARAIKHVPVLQAVIITTCEPILNPLWVMLFIGEKPGPWSIAGGALVIAAATLRALKSNRPEAPGEAVTA
ncbi:MAG TPA: DMT family transporter [Chthoniobacterales bacterium]